MESVLTALGCIAEVLPEKAAGQLRSVVASVVVKQVITAIVFQIKFFIILAVIRRRVERFGRVHLRIIAPGQHSSVAAVAIR